MGKITVHLEREFTRPDVPKGPCGMAWFHVSDREVEEIEAAIVSQDRPTVARALVRVIDPDRKP